METYSFKHIFLALVLAFLGAVSMPAAAADHQQQTIPQVLQAGVAPEKMELVANDAELAAKFKKSDKILACALALFATFTVLTSLGAWWKAPKENKTLPMLASRIVLNGLICIALLGIYMSASTEGEIRRRAYDAKREMLISKEVQKRIHSSNQ